MYLAPIILQHWISCTDQSIKSLVEWGRDLCIIFRSKLVFFCSFSHNVHAKQLTFYHLQWKQCPKSNQNIPNHCSTWTLGNFSSACLCSTNQIPFCHIRFCSITCHFLVNNLHFIMYSTCIIQHHWKNSHGALFYW